MAALLIGCGNCGDGSGWQVWRPNGGRGFVWVACADCNDDGKKPKPDLCEGCGETEPFCLCGLRGEKDEGDEQPAEPVPA